MNTLRIVVLLSLMVTVAPWGSDSHLGIYMAQDYLENLSKTRSHLNSMRVEGPQAIYIYKNKDQIEFMELYNFHEGSVSELAMPYQEVFIGCRAYDIQRGVIKETTSGRIYQEVVIEEDNPAEYDQEKYDQDLGEIILAKLFDKKEYASDLGKVKVQKGFLLLDNVKYKLALDTVWTPLSNTTKYDVFQSAENALIGFKVLSSKLYVARLALVGFEVRIKDDKLYVLK